MAIEVDCPNGHVLKVKDKYAGKKGFCPLCDGEVVVTVPQKLSENEIVELIVAPPPLAENASASVLDDTVDSESVLDPAHEGDSAMSLAVLSAIQQLVKCPECSGAIPFWTAKCPHCDALVRGNRVR